MVFVRFTLPDANVEIIQYGAYFGAGFIGGTVGQKTVRGAAVAYVAF
jgi:hypothetical protein